MLTFIYRDHSVEMDEYAVLDSQAQHGLNLPQAIMLSLDRMIACGLPDHAAVRVYIQTHPGPDSCETRLVVQRRDFDLSVRDLPGLLAPGIDVVEIS